MQIKVTEREIEKLYDELEIAQRQYLEERGWENTCDHPDSCWRWEKDIKWMSERRWKTKHYCLSRKDAVALQIVIDSHGVTGVCCNCGYHGQEETPCPEREDGTHCEHWWDGEAAS